MRGSSDPPPGSATPGDSATSGMKLRPSSGSVSIFVSVHVVADRAARGLQQGRLRVHIDRLRWLPHLQPHVQPYLICDPQRDARLSVGAESRFLDRQRILSGRQTQQVILAALVGRRGETCARCKFIR